MLKNYALMTQLTPKWKTPDYNIDMNRCFFPYQVLRVGLRSSRSYRNAFDVLPSLQRPTHTRYLSTSRLLKQFYPPDGKRPDDKDKKPPEGLSSFVNFLSFVALGLSFLYFTRRNKGNGQSPDDAFTQQQRTVSWREFVGDMLAKGEVEQIVVNPPNTRVFIKLHDNAVLKGQSMSSNILPPVFQMEVPSLASFEDNLRKAERELGIPADRGVLVVYNRVNAT
uniref:Peptidase M41 FtsH extracellular domain-containing protein n=1 Tax=Romanomermis culicivorax TaxID=13658 RepID=A0A915JMK1_ROMCU